MEGRSVKTRADVRGLSLIELMFAIAIIAIALFAICSMVLQTVAMREAARETETAKEWVQKKLEEVRSRPFTDVRTAYPPPAGSNVYTATFVAPAVPTGLSGAIGILTVDYSNAKLTEAVARIDWKGRRGPSSYSLRTLGAE